MDHFPNFFFSRLKHYVSRFKSFLFMWIPFWFSVSGSVFFSWPDRGKGTSVKIKDWDLSWAVIKQDPWLLSRGFTSCTSSSTAAHSSFDCQDLQARSDRSSWFILCPLAVVCCLSDFNNLCGQGKMLFHPLPVLSVVYISSKSVLG